ncbi:MAG: hypothetical protein ABSG68_09855 [Thermoguttaceae bacterium]
MRKSPRSRLRAFGGFFDHRSLVKRAPGRPLARPAYRRLALEPLEARTLLTALTVQYRFYSSDPGAADTAPGLTALPVGQNFYLEALIQDTRTVPQGVLQTYFNVSFSSGVVSTAPDSTITYGQYYKDLPAGTLSLGANNAVNGINDVGAQQSQSLSSAGDVFPLYSLELHAQSAGTLTLNTTVAGGNQYATASRSRPTRPRRSPARTTPRLPWGPRAVSA